MNPFTLHGTPLLLSPEGTAFLPETATLIAADIHLGKSAAFRAHGLPIPEGDAARDLERLERLVRHHGAAELVIAGDLFHGPTGITPEIEEELGAFIVSLGIPFILVAGNHDAKFRKLPCELVSVPVLNRGRARIIHDPADAGAEGLHFAGHWHPVVRIPDGKRTSLRMPCFLLRKNTMVLPAFGGFTGGAVISPEAGDRFFVPLRENVVEVPRELWAKDRVLKRK